jgi:hypothetical protein
VRFHILPHGRVRVLVDAKRRRSMFDEDMRQSNLELPELAGLFRE